MAVRQFAVAAALESYQALCGSLAGLTEEEVLACLELEAGSLRRPSIINRLIARAARLRELEYSRQLKEKFHGTSPIEDPERR